MVYLVNNSKIPILNNIIGINPTGIIDYNGTFKMNGPNDVIKNSSTASYDNLVLSQNNNIVCDSIEKFTNDKNIFYGRIIIILFIILFILLVLYFFI